MQAKSTSDFTSNEEADKWSNQQKQIQRTLPTKVKLVEAAVQTEKHINQTAWGESIKQSGKNS